MKRRHRPPEQGVTAKTIATFGSARIIKNLNGGMEILGGAEVDRVKAHRWMRSQLVPLRRGSVL